MRRLVLVSVGLCLVAASSAAAQRHSPEPIEDDHASSSSSARIDGEPDEGSVHPGATFAFEVTPIEHWLEIEAGISAVPADGGTSPELIHATGSDHATYWGLSAVLDFMFSRERTSVGTSSRDTRSRFGMRRRIMDGESPRDC